MAKRNKIAVRFLMVAMAITCLLGLASCRGTKVDVAFSVNGTITSTQSLKVGQTVVRPADPVAEEGYVFDDWYADAGYTEVYDFSVPVSTDVTIYAHFWETVQVTFYIRGVTMPQTIIKGRTAEKPANPAFEGYHFDNWYADAGCTEVYDFSAPVNENITVYANLEINVYTVTFVLNNESDAYVTQSVEHGNSASEPDAPAVPDANYVFKGWFADEEYSEEYDFNAAIKQDTVVYGIIGGKTTAVTLDKDGSAMQENINTSVDFGDVYTLPVPESTKGNWLFGGWYAEPNGQGAQYTDELGRGVRPWNSVKENVTLYSKWYEALSFTLSSNGNFYYVLGGREINQLSVVTIPQYYDGLPVESVDSFLNANVMTELRVPDTIKTIETNSGVFEGCNKLSAITVYETGDNDIGGYTSENGILLYNNEFTNRKELAWVPNALRGELVVPEGVEILPLNVLSGRYFTKITFPSTLVSIERGAVAAGYTNTYLTEVVFNSPADPDEAEPLSIAALAFQNNKALASVNLPAHIKNLDTDAFSGCEALERVNINAENNVGLHFASVDGVLTDVNGSTIVYCPTGRTGEYAVTSSKIVEIGDKAFSGCKKLTKVVIGSQVTKIGASAFSGCNGLLDLVFEGGVDDNLINIGEQAFYGCTKVAALTLPANTGTVGSNAFGNMQALKTVVIDSGSNAKYASNSFLTTNNGGYVTALYINVNVASDIDFGMFGPKLEAVTIDDNNPNFATVDGVVYNKEITEIKFFPAGRTDAYVLPDTITSIGANVFKGKTNLTEITFNKNVASIGVSAFEGCTGLTKIVFESGEGGAASLAIGNSAFSGCSNITSLTFPARLKSIGDKAFFGLSKVTELNLPEGLETIGDAAFQNMYALEEVNIPSTVTELKVTNKGRLQVFLNDAGIEEITVAEGNANYASVDGVLYTKNSDGELSGLLLVPLNNKIAELNVPGTVANVAPYALYNNTSVKKVTFADSAEGVHLTISDSAFSNCYALEEVVLPKGITQLTGDQNYIFQYCFALKKVTIPNTVTKIASGKQGVFYNCPELEEVIFEAGNDDVSLSIEGVKQSSNYYGVFSGCPKIASIVLPARTSNIGVGAFCWLPGLTYINIPANVTAIGDYAFYKGGTSSGNRNAALATVEIEEGSKLQTIGAYAFYGTGIEEIDLPDSVNSIGDYAFGLTRLKKVTIPASLTTINTGLFSYATLLEEVDFARDESGNSAVTSIGAYAFDYCLSLETLTIPASVTNIGKAAASSTSGYVIRYAENLKEIVFEEGERETLALENYTFKYSSLERVVFPETERAYTLPWYLFDGSTQPITVTLSKSVSGVERTFNNALVSLTIDPANENLVYDNGIIYNKDKTSILGYATGGDTQIDEIRIPETVATLGQYAFEYMEGVKKVYIPASVTTIGGNVFSNSTVQEVEFASDSAITALPDRAFSVCKELRSVKLPAGLKSIGANAFISNYALQTIDLPDGLTTIGGSAFSQSGLVSIEIPDSVVANGAVTANNSIFSNCHSLVTAKLSENMTTLCNSLFVNCENLTTVTGLGDVKLIGQAFNGCASLTTIRLAGQDETVTGINLPASVTSLGASAFKGCESIRSIIVPEVTKIDTSTFNGCISLEEVVIPESVTTIGDAAFLGCTSLVSVTIPSKVTTISKAAFAGCTSLTTVNFTAKENGAYALTTITAGTAVYAATATTAGAFANCTALEELNLPDSVTTLGGYTFHSAGLKSFTVPAGVTAIGVYTFANCENLESVVLQQGLTTINSYAFKNSGLKSLEIPASVTKLGTNATSAYNAFEDCVSLESVTLPDTLTLIGMRTFSGTTSLSSINLPASLDTIGNYAFANSGITSVDIPANLATLGTYAFQNSGLTKVILPDTIVTVPNYAFSGCADLASVTFGARVNAINQYAFNSCTALTSVDLPDTLTTIGNYAFQGSGLNSLFIGPDVTSIGSGAFGNCEDLASYQVSNGNSKFNVSADGALLDADGKVIVYPTGATLTVTVTADTEVSASAFAFCGNGIKVVIADGVTAITDSMFRDFTGLEEIEIPASVRSIGQYAFYGCTNLKKVVLHEGLESIGNFAFQNCASLEEINLPAGLKTIGATGFRGCTSLTSITIPSTVKRYFTVGTTGTPVVNDGIGQNAFYGCTSLKNLVIEEGVDSIGASAFAYCGVEELELPSSLVSYKLGSTTSEAVGGSSFSYCADLVKVKFGNGIDRIAYYAFRNCTSLKEIEFAESITYIGYSAFMGCTALETVTLPDSVTEVGYQIFDGCTALTSVDLGSGLKTLGHLAFQNCTALETIVIPENVIAFTATSSSQNPFNNWTENQTVCFAFSRAEMIARYGNNWYYNPAYNLVYNYVAE